MKRLIIFLFLIISLGCACFSYGDNGQNINTDRNGYANALLFHVEYDLDLLLYCRNKYNDDEVLISKIEEMLFRKLAVISEISPTVDDLQGTPLITLIRIINYRNDYNCKYFGTFNDKIVKDYLHSIRASLIEKRDKYQKVPLNEFIIFYENLDQEKVNFN